MPSILSCRFGGFRTAPPEATCYDAPCIKLVVIGIRGCYTPSYIVPSIVVGRSCAVAQARYDNMVYGVSYRIDVNNIIPLSELLEHFIKSCLDISRGYDVVWRASCIIYGHIMLCRDLMLMAGALATQLTKPTALYYFTIFHTVSAPLICCSRNTENWSEGAKQINDLLFRPAIEEARRQPPMHWTPRTPVGMRYGVQ